MLNHKKNNLIQCGINPFFSPETGCYNLTEIAWDVTVVIKKIIHARPHLKQEEQLDVNAGDGLIELPDQQSMRSI